MGDAELEHRLTELEQKTKSNTRRIEKLEDIQKELRIISTSLVSVTEKLNYTNDTVTGLKEKVEELDGQPKKTLLSIKAAIITAITSGMISIAISLVFGLR